MRPSDRRDIRIERIRGIPLQAALMEYGISFNEHSFALCPFHAEDTASFLCRPGDRRWKCFGCGRNGDLVDFVMQSSGMRFSEALDRIERDFHLSGHSVRPSELRALDARRMAESTRRKRETAAEAEYLDALEDWLNTGRRLHLAQRCDPLGAYRARLLWDEHKALMGLIDAENRRASVTAEYRQKRGDR